MTTARFIYDNPLKNTDLYYATKFTSHDPIAFVEFKEKKYLVVDTLEFGRAKKQARVDKVLLASDYKNNVEIRKGNPPDVADIMDAILKKLGAKTLEVPGSFPLSLAEKFRAKKYKLVIGPSPFFPEKSKKGPREKSMMIEVQKNTFKLIALVEKTLAKTRISGNKLLFKGKTVTSEFLRELVQIEAIRLGYDLKEGLIVACGDDSIDPHSIGSGPIRPFQSIVVDIFGSSQKSLLWGDATRTFCRGRASPELKKLYNTVLQGQAMAIKSIKHGVNGRIVHEKVLNFFGSFGYKTGLLNGRHQGFIHGTGHGIGLDIHECPPFIAAKDCTLEAGNVTSVEPGLYYKGIGGVRIEDLVYVTKNGCEILAGYPKRLEI
jgi:Xaa-Pro aminopeptidase